MSNPVRRIFPPLTSLPRLLDLLLRHVIVWVIEAIILTLLLNIFTSDPDTTLRLAISVVVLLSLLNTLLQPLILSLFARMASFLFPILSFVLNVAIVMTVSALSDEFQVPGWFEASIIALVMAVLNTLLGLLLSIPDDGAWRRFALQPLRARYARAQTPIITPAYVFLEIDGLSAETLRFALDHGYAPTLKSWLEDGSHRLHEWETDLSSQTGASQAGILLGNNDGYVAYRWFDRQLGRVVTSTTDANMLEHRFSRGDGLLHPDGASRGNLFTGDAADTLFTFASLRTRGTSASGAYYRFWLNFYNLARTLALFFADVIRETVAASWQVLRNERPRVRRFGIYPLVRAATTSLLRELSTFTVAADIMRGVPSVYTTFIAYDEVAHHSGVRRGDTMRVLREVDRDIGRIAAEAGRGPRPYHVIVLSDHGQSQGQTFRQLNGRPLAAIVDDLMSGKEDSAVHDRVIAHVSTDEGWQLLSAVLTQAMASDGSPSRLRDLVQQRLDRVQLELGGNERPQVRQTRPEVAAANAVVVASGNLALVTFPNLNERATTATIDARYPALIPGLLLTPGIGWIMVKSASGDALVLGQGGIINVTTGDITGHDPLADFGPTAIDHLRRTNAFAEAPDLLIGSTYDPETGDVHAFEELVGSHGGIGGAQGHPFLLVPSDLEMPPEPIIGAENIYRLFTGWMLDDGTPTL